MLPIILLLLIWLPALVGLGWPLVRPLGGRLGAVARSTAFAGLLGILVASVVASAVGFFTAVRPAASVPLLIAGWSLALHHRRTWLRLPRRAWLTAAAVVAVVVVLDARGVPWYDTGLYHLQAVAWAGDGPLPRGLANLYGPLGYSCAWFPFAAAVEFPGAAGNGAFVANAIVFVLAALPGVDAAVRVGRRVRGDAVVYVLALFPLAEFGCRRGMISSLAPDPLAITLALFAAAAWVRSPRAAPLAFALAAFAVTVKLSAGPLMVVAAIAMVVGPNRRWRMAVVTSAVAGVVWLARAVWLSGCPLFPSTLGRLASLPWADQPADAHHTAAAIACWSKYRRVVEAVMPGEPWVAGWVRRVGLSEPIVVAVVVFVAGVILLVARRSRLAVAPKGHPAEGSKSAPSGRPLNGWFTPAGRGALVAAVAMVPGAALWFALAPDVRFGYGYVFGIASLIFAAAFDGLRPPGRWRYAAGVIVLAAAGRLDHRLFQGTLLRWPAIPAAPRLVTNHTVDGTPVLTSVVDDRVWAATRPATWEFNPTLRCVRDGRGRIREFDVSRALFAEPSVP